MKWYGWGEEGEEFSVESRPEVLPYLQSVLGLDVTTREPPVSLAEVDLPAAAIGSEVLDGLLQIAGESGVTTDRKERILHAMGKSTIDLIRIRRGYVPHAPDAVVYPQTAEQILRILQLAAQNRIAVVPFGGGTSVVGGVEALRGDQRWVITLDLARMNRLINVDAVSRTATAQAGIRGPDLERALDQQGFTLGHFPQSFEYSTLGGWAATRSAGQQSTLYGKIEDMIIGLTLVTSSGMIQTRNVPASASGPSLKQMLIGSEGILGVITDCTLRIHRIPEIRDYRGFFFRTFESGLEAARKILQSELHPSLVRLSDSTETEAMLKLRPHPRTWKERAGKKLLHLRGYEGGCLMILGFEGDRNRVAQDWSAATQVGTTEAFSLGSAPGRSWLKERFKGPYLRDWLLDHAVLIDTLETATLWSQTPALYHKVKDAIEGAISASGLQSLVMAHLSHAYPEGASLYFTFLARRLIGREIDQWRAIKEAATNCILENGGTISHHHGIGCDHTAWIEQEHGPEGKKALASLKRALDPHGILNPGKLVP